MSVLDDVRQAWKKGGPRHLLSRAPGYAKKNLLYQLYNPYGTLDRKKMLDGAECEICCWRSGSETELEFAPPLSGHPPAEYQSLQGIHEIPPPFVCEVPDVTLVGERALSRLQDGRYLLEEMGTETMLRYRLLQYFDALPLREKPGAIAKPAPGDVKNTEYDRLVNLVPRHGGSHNNYTNFGHWLLEDLPRLRTVERYADRTGETPEILIRPDPPDWMLSTLRLLGFSDSDWTVWKGESVTVSKLVVPELRYIHSLGAQLHPVDRMSMVDEMKSRADIEAEYDGSRRIFISRQGQERRRIRNFDEVMTAIRPLGFEPIRPEELTLEEQIRMFDRANIIVGPFGAGLTGALFADDATLIEIKPYGTAHTIYYIVATEAGLEYDFLMGEPPAKSRTRIKKDADMRVDTEKLVQTIENVI